jgi:hypothetical protein
MAITIKSNGSKRLEKIVERAHKICNNILLFEAIELAEDEVRLFLNCNQVLDKKIQDEYLLLVRLYEEKTSNRRTRRN